MKLKKSKKSRIKMLQSKNFNFILLISFSAFFYANAQTNFCWNPSTGTQVNCVSPNNLYCVTNYATGVGSCSATQSTDPNILYCNSGDGCNQIVTQCYNPIILLRTDRIFIFFDKSFNFI